MLLAKSAFVILICDLFMASGFSSNLANVRMKRQSHVFITNTDIHRFLRKLDSKLARHEYREAQSADITMKILNKLVAGQTTAKNDLKTVSKQLASMEEKMFAIESLISTTDERQRHMIKGSSEGINRLIQMSSMQELLPMPGGNPNQGLAATGEEMRSLLKKFEDVDNAMQRDIKTIQGELTTVFEAMTNHMTRLETMFEGHLLVDYNKNRDHNHTMDDMSEMITRANKQLTQELIEVKNAAIKSDSTDSCAAAVKEIAQKLDSLDAYQRQQAKEVSDADIKTQLAIVSQNRDLRTLFDANVADRQLVEDSFRSIVQNLQNLQSESDKQLGTLESNIENVLEVSADKINFGINNVASILKLKSTNILDALDDSSAQSSNIQDTMRDSFVDLTGEIRGLKKLEQVMISTADAVLDTKRSIEFGIQQVIIELSDIVRNNGRTINSTLTDRINDISSAILKSQTAALTNMTTKIEQEISQVWRQIGVMYQQILQSVVILDDLQSATSHQMNQSLNTVDHMDGTVDKINSKVAGVEDDLNYLLGRLTLVVSEFSQLKSGVGDELDRLRDMTKEFSNEAIVEYQLQNEDVNSVEEVESS